MAEDASAYRGSIDVVAVPSFRGYLLVLRRCTSDAPFVLPDGLHVQCVSPEDGQFAKCVGANPWERGECVNPFLSIGPVVIFI